MHDPVLEWLKVIRDEGPQLRPEGRVGSSARRLGWTDFQVRHKGTGQVMLLQDLRAMEPVEYYRWVDYMDGREALTSEGLDAVKAYDIG